MQKVSIGSSSNHYSRTINVGSNSNPHSALRTKENNVAGAIGTTGNYNDQLKSSKRNTFYASSNSSAALQKVGGKASALTNRNLSFNSTNSTRLINAQVAGAQSLRD